MTPKRRLSIWEIYLRGIEHAFGAQLGLVAWLARRTRLAREDIEPGPSERRAVGRGRGSGISKVWAVDTAGLRAFTISAGTSRRL